MSHSTDSTAPALTRSRSTATRKMILTAMFACLAFVLNTFVYFPAMAPFQHFVDVLAAVFVGPWYAFAAALLCGILRMLSGRTIQAVAGAIFGPILGGLLYRKFHNFWVVLLVSYPLMKLFYGLDAQSPFYYIPFYTPSAVVGGCMGVAVLLILKRTGMLDRMLSQLNR